MRPMTRTDPPPVTTAMTSRKSNMFVALSCLSMASASVVREVHERYGLSEVHDRRAHIAL